MKKTYKTIRLSEETYKQLIDYRAEVEAINHCRLSFDEAVDMLLGETEGMEYEVKAEVSRFAKAQTNCTCGACEAIAPPIEYQIERLGQ